MEMDIGEVYLKLAGTYHGLPSTLVEAVQNATDAGARRIFVGVDAAHSIAVVLDDGTGIHVDKFQVALKSVGRGIKSEDRMGKFGLGLISPLHLCKQFTISSLPEDCEMANMWTFVSEDIRKERVQVRIPCRSLPALPELPPQFACANDMGVTWRTILRIDGLVSDEEMTTVHLDDFSDRVRTKLRYGMQRNGTVVHVVVFGANGQSQSCEINALKFTGEKLPVVEINDPTLRCGVATFELGIAPEIQPGTRNGYILLKQDGDTSYIAWREFFAQALGSRQLRRYKEVFDALGSRYFEGVISATGLTLVKERDKFENNDALRDFYKALQLWFDQHGKNLFKDERDFQRYERYRGLGQQSIRRIIEQLKTPDFAGVTRRLSDILPDAHIPPSEPSGPKEKEDGNNDDGDSTSPQPRKRRRVITDPPQPRDDRHAGNGFTLRFAYEILQSGRLWEYERGVLIFNILHPLWVSVDETDGKHTTRHDRQVMHLQEYLALRWLLLLSEQASTEQDLEHLRGPIDKELKYYIKMFVLEEARKQGVDEG